MLFKKNIFRLTLFFLSITFFCSCQKIAKKSKPTFSVQVDKWRKEGNVNFLLVKTTLTNTSPDTISYISMSCSWQDPYTTDSKDLSIYINECDKNIPRLIKIPPHSKQDTDIKLISRKTIDELIGLQFRVGFNLVTSKNYNEMFSKVSQLSEMKNVIWSDTLKLK